ncbi:hypothetical protein Areg01_23010 [Actinoplanes regularis]|nr:hypothetical protein Areg01_23010 [Actinoplanes regularis]
MSRRNSNSQYSRKAFQPRQTPTAPATLKWRSGSTGALQTRTVNAAARGEPRPQTLAHNQSLLG